MAIAKCQMSTYWLPPCALARISHQESTAASGLAALSLRGRSPSGAEPELESSPSLRAGELSEPEAGLEGGGSGYVYFVTLGRPFAAHRSG
jgi:hypothetical protein